MNKYLSSINKKTQPAIIEKILLQAKELDTPIISDEGINLLIQLIKIGKVKKVLEIGSAIGYSAIMMALNGFVEVATIEKDESAFLKAKENISEAKLTEKIKIIHGDALEVNVKGFYDLLFIDAAKAQYLKFLEKFKDNLNSGAIVVCDNLLFHGLVENPNEASGKRVKSLVMKIALFNEELINHPDFETYIYEIGDGMSISIKK
ncbi:MAG: O-methyltransferase [Candidatus Izemoplasmatales bacterium]|nr:O-methyltransferase [Candidatus Izemoplasmatales bacterium]